MPDFENKTPDTKTRKDFVDALGKGIAEALILSDVRGNIISFNDAAVGLLKYNAEELGSCSIGDIFPEGLPDEFSILDVALARPLKKGSATPHLCEIKTKDNEILIVQTMITHLTDTDGDSAETVIILKEIAEIPLNDSDPERPVDMVAHNQLELELMEANSRLCQRVNQTTKKMESLEAQLLHAQKMAAIGQLVSGVTHEISNTLMAVYGCAQMALRDTATIKGESNLQSLIEETRRAMDTVRNLLMFARKNGSQKQRGIINDAILRTLNLKTYDLTHCNIKVTSKLDQDIPEVMADFNQLQQVFLNIITNAQHAIMETGQSGTIHISNYQIDENIRVTISNSGPNIPIDIMDRIFDPFFTTKNEDQGTGLGLSTCYGIIEDHGGKISVRNNEDTGVTFTICLPVAGLDDKAE